MAPEPAPPPWAAEEARTLVISGRWCSSVLSLPFLIDELEPQLAAVLAGDPANGATPGS